MRRQASSQHPVLGILQLLQITIGNIVAAPIWHRIELYAMRKLHVVFFEKLLELSLRLSAPPSSVDFCSPLSTGSEVDKLDFVASVLDRSQKWLRPWRRQCIGLSLLHSAHAVLFDYGGSAGVQLEGW